MNDNTIWTSIRERANELKQRSLEKKILTKEEKEQVFKARARKLSEKWDLDPDSKERFSCITFQIRNENYAISTFSIAEIFKAEKISFIPCIPSFFAGMTNHRGKPLTILNLAGLFSLQGKSTASNIEPDQKSYQGDGLHSSGNKIMVIEDNGLRAGIMIDRIEGLIELELSQIKKVSSVLAEKNSYIKSEVLLHNKQTHIIDVPLLLTSKSLIVNQSN